MFGRGFLFSGILVAAFVVPYYLDQSSSELGQSSSETSFNVRQWWDSLWTDSLDDRRLSSSQSGQQRLWSAEQLAEITGQHHTPIGGNGAYSGIPQQTLSPNPPYAGPGAAGLGSTGWGAPGVGVPATSISRQRLTGPEVASIADVIRMDVNRGWVMNNWARVSTNLMDRNLEGLRVPIVSGTSVHDVAGSLTYFFDRQQVLQRVTFEGHSGDPSQLVALATRYYGLRQEPSLGPGMFMARKKDQITSALRISQGAVATTDRPLERYQVMLELNSSDSKYGLSEGYLNVLKLDQQTQRWSPDANE